MNDKTILTKNGLEELQKEYDWRINIERKKIADDIDRARQQGDLSENSSYKAAMENKEFNEVKISELEKIIQSATIIEQNNSNKVSIGSRVTITDQVTKVERIFTIVGENEADPSQNKISFKSPLASILMGKKVGQIVNFETSINKTTYLIKAID